MSKPKLIRPSDLDASNRKLLAAAQQAGLSSDEIIRKSLAAAYGKLLRPEAGGRPDRKVVAVSKNHNHKVAVKPAATKMFQGG